MVNRSLFKPVHLFGTDTGPLLTISGSEIRLRAAYDGVHDPGLHATVGMHVPADRDLPMAIATSVRIG